MAAIGSRTSVSLGSFEARSTLEALLRVLWAVPCMFLQCVLLGVK